MTRVRTKVRVVIYSDQPILAAGMESLIAADPDLESSGWCQGISSLRERLANENPDLAVVDLTPQMTVTALTELQKLSRGCKLILWTRSIEGDIALQALTIGIRGVLRKTLPLEAHRQCLHRVYSGDLWVEKSLADSVFARQRVTLTPRESQLVNLLSRGLKNKEIAAELGLTEGTVKVYLAHLFKFQSHALAGATTADDAKSFAVADLEGHLAQNLLCAKRFRNLAECHSPGFASHRALSGKMKNMKNMNLIRRTSSRMISSEEITTLRVAARPTPWAPSFVVYPRKQETVPMTKPNTAVFRVGAQKLEKWNAEKARET